MLLGALLYRMVNNRHTRKFSNTNLSSSNLADPPSALKSPVVYEEVSHDICTERSNNNMIELEEPVGLCPALVYSKLYNDSLSLINGMDTLTSNVTY